MANGTDKRKAKLPPTLIVGLGGTGCEIISRVDKLANEEQRKFIRFVFFDTDANELRQRKEEAPYIYTVQTSRKLTVGQALRNDVEARDNTFPKNQQLFNKPLTEGAGQIRAISKLAFDACLREGRVKPLHDAINELQKLNGDDLEQSMRVVVVSTLVGGTGSGILLPLSMYLRHYLETTCQKKPLIRGFVVLPDVFFHGSNKPETEKNNLRANAYATLRELDAFMLKSDSMDASNLRGKYSLKLPRPGTVNEYDEYNDSPMDFCFLFDGQNIDGDGLQSFTEYKRHAADCIYASSISKLNKRLNSSEDNTILERCAANGRNRYCGIGTSKIIYPFNQVRDYIAMNWMSQAMTENWLRYDKKYEEEMVKRQASRARGAGMHLPPIDKHDLYCQLVEQENDEHNNFSMALIEECYNKDKQGISITTPRWDSYFDKLKDYIEDKTKATNYDEGIGNQLTEKLSELGSLTEDVNNFKVVFPSVVQLMKLYFSVVKRHAEASANISADSIFSPDNFNIKEEHHIEYWLSPNGVPLHPNSIRFFLYSVEKKMKEELRKLDTKTAPGEDVISTEATFADLEDSIRSFYEESPQWHLENSDGTSKYYTISTLVSSLRAKSLFGSGLSKDELVGKMLEVSAACEAHQEQIKQYYGAFLRRAILKKGIEYVGRLSEIYEEFFSLLDVEIKRIPRRIKRLEDDFNNSDGSPVMYVCASKECLHGLLERCPNTIDPIMLTEAFRSKLFYSVFDSLKIDESKQKNAITKLVSDDIIDFWRESVISQYGKVVDMDVIDALSVQADLEKDRTSPDEQYYYIANKVSEAYKLSAPFIDRPIGREPYIIDACAVSTSVARTDDIQKASILSTIFSNSEKDPLLDKYQIVFMKALYNLRISDLLKFAPEDNSEVDPHAAGDYYTAYHARIDSILPDSMKTRNITPHIDKRWHYTGVLPELDERSEKIGKFEAQKAFVLSVIYGYVKFYEDQYRFTDKKGDYITDNIVVGDGRCNKFHEIYEAMLINRPLVLSIIGRFDDTVKGERNEDSIGNKNYTETKMHHLLNDFTIQAYKQITRVSILEIPILYKTSLGNSDVKDDELIEMLHNIMRIMDDYLKSFYPNAILREEYYADWLAEQTMVMFDNIVEKYDNGIDNTVVSAPAHDSLLSRIVNNILTRFDNFDTEAARQKKAPLEKRWSEIIK